jgi:probable H4MPT-linked C1 transfer pathway protein
VSRPEAPGCIVGWDVGGAHLKACLVEGGAVRDAGQWPCALWQGLQQLDAALEAVRRHWPMAWGASTRHVVTMTGEMVDLFAHRQEGVARLAGHLAERLGPSLAFYGGRAGWVAPHETAAQWAAIASANWRASAELLAARVPDALLLDIGSTTTDLVPVRGGRVVAEGDGDAERLSTGELVYQGVVRTPLCALGPRVTFGEREVNVMNEFFATTADVYRLTGELDPAHDQHPPADLAGKDATSTRQRLARMIGRDARDADAPAWLALAHAWRAAQLAEIEGQLRRVIASAALPARAPLVAAGCGAFLVHELAARLGRESLGYVRAVRAVPGEHDGLARRAALCAPALAVAVLAAG